MHVLQLQEECPGANPSNVNGKSMVATISQKGLDEVRTSKKDIVTTSLKVKDKGHALRQSDPGSVQIDRTAIRRRNSSRWCGSKKTSRVSPSTVDGTQRKTAKNLLKQIVPSAGKLGKQVKMKIPGRYKSSKVLRKQQVFRIEDHSCFYVDKIITIEGSSWINERDLNGNTQLHLAVISCCTLCITKLIQSTSSTSDINVSNDEGNTALMYACKNNYAEACELLLGYGARVDLVKNRLGETAVHLAAAAGQYGNNACLRAVLRYGPDANVQDQRGLTPLHMVIFQPTENDEENIDVLCDLIREGVDFHAKCRLKEIYKGRTTDAFQLAVCLFHVPAMILMIEAGYQVMPCDLTTDWSAGQRRHPVEDNSPLKLYLRSKSNSPQSLMSLCRTSIRGTVPRTKLVAHLGLPKLMVEYLNFAGLERQCLELLQQLNHGYK